MPVTARQMTKGARRFLNALANTTGMSMEAMHVMTVLMVDRSPAMGAAAGSPMRAVTAGTM